MLIFSSTVTTLETLQAQQTRGILYSNI